LDSGALYRLVAYAGQRRGLSSYDESGHADIALNLDVQIALGPHGGEQIWLAGEEVSQRIRTEQAGEGASRVAAMPGVRTALLDRQRAFSGPPGLGAEGPGLGAGVCAQ